MEFNRIINKDNDENIIFKKIPSQYKNSNKTANSINKTLLITPKICSNIDENLEKNTNMKENKLVISSLILNNDKKDDHVELENKRHSSVKFKQVSKKINHNKNNKNISLKCINSKNNTSSLNSKLIYNTKNNYIEKGLNLIKGNLISDKSDHKIFFNLSQIENDKNIDECAHLKKVLDNYKLLLNTNLKNNFSPKFTDSEAILKKHISILEKRIFNKKSYLKSSSLNNKKNKKNNEDNCFNDDSALNSEKSNNNNNLNNQIQHPDKRKAEIENFIKKIAIESVGKFNQYDNEEIIVNEKKNAIGLKNIHDLNNLDIIEMIPPVIV